MQLAVAETFADRVNLDPLAESETLESARSFMSEVGVPDDSVAVTVGLLVVRRFAVVERDQNPAPQPVEQLEEVEVVMGEPVPQEVPDVNPDKRRNMENTRVQQLGDDPRKVLSEARKDILILHRLGACFRVPGIDYLRFRFSGTEMPSGSEFHQVCSLCAKAGAVDRAERGSSGTQTSSSTDED